MKTQKQRMVIVAILMILTVGAGAQHMVTVY